MKDVYQRLAEFLDTFPQRYPLNTESGIELKILKHIFSPEAAEIYMQLKQQPQTASQIAERIGGSPDEVEQKLYEMSKRGQVYRSGKEGNRKYMPTAFLVGLIEFQMSRMTPELAKDMQAFEPVLYPATWLKGEIRDLRTIPIAESIASGTEVRPYESVEETIRTAKYIAISDCMCRRLKELVNEPCRHPVEVCFHFGSDTHYFVENGMGRYISRDEALAILKKGKEAGLVCQLSASQSPGAMCMCCGCCCGPLRAFKQLAKPSGMVNSNFFARVNEAECTGCEICLERCPMDAVSMGDSAAIDPDRCIGCGVCAYSCPTEAIRVYRKEKDREFIPEKDIVSSSMAMYRQRRS